MGAAIQSTSGSRRAPRRLGAADRHRDRALLLASALFHRGRQEGSSRARARDVCREGHDLDLDGPYSSNDIRADLELQAEGALPLRIRMYYHVPQMISLDGLLSMGFVSGVGSDMFRF